MPSLKWTPPLFRNLNVICFSQFSDSCYTLRPCRPLLFTYKTIQIMKLVLIDMYFCYLLNYVQISSPLCSQHPVTVCYGPYGGGKNVRSWKLRNGHPVSESYVLKSGAQMTQLQYTTSSEAHQWTAAYSTLLRQVWRIEAWYAAYLAGSAFH
jgi:hypothetical protein